MKQLTSLTTLLLFLLVGIGFTSCSDDDDKDTNDNISISSIIGTWELNEEDLPYGYYYRMTFKTGGIGYYEEKGSEYFKEGFTYTYKNDILTIRYDDEYDDIDRYSIKSISKSKLILIDKYDDEKEIYYRVE